LLVLTADENRLTASAPASGPASVRGTVRPLQDSLRQHGPTTRLWLSVAFSFADRDICLPDRGPQENQPKSAPTFDESNGALRFGATPSPFRYRTRTAWPPPLQHQESAPANKFSGTATLLCLASKQLDGDRSHSGTPGRSAYGRSRVTYRTLTVKKRSLRYGQPSLRDNDTAGWRTSLPK